MAWCHTGATYEYQLLAVAETWAIYSKAEKYIVGLIQGVLPLWGLCGGQHNLPHLHEVDKLNIYYCYPTLRCEKHQIWQVLS